ncbi:hypothetical protein LIA77_06024 [Sarocladium implicatum]|nr:hypothetical protein LIA77_06024 [Sarocladium implicatum]
MSCLLAFSPCKGKLVPHARPQIGARPRTTARGEYARVCALTPKYPPPFEDKGPEIISPASLFPAKIIMLLHPLSQPRATPASTYNYCTVSHPLGQAGMTVSLRTRPSRAVSCHWHVMSCRDATAFRFSTFPAKTCQLPK